MAVRDREAKSLERRRGEVEAEHIVRVVAQGQPFDDWEVAVGGMEGQHKGRNRRAEADPSRQSRGRYSVPARLVSQRLQRRGRRD